MKVFDLLWDKLLSFDCFWWTQVGSFLGKKSL